MVDACTDVAIGFAVTADAAAGTLIPFLYICLLNNT